MKPLFTGQPYSEEWFTRIAESEGITIEEAISRVNKAQKFDPYKNAGPHPFFKFKFEDKKIIEVEWQSPVNIESAIQCLTGNPPGIIYWKVLFDDKGVTDMAHVTQEDKAKEVQS